MGERWLPEVTIHPNHGLGGAVAQRGRGRIAARWIAAARSHRRYLGILAHMDTTQEAKAWPFMCPHCDQPSSAVVCGKAVWDGFDESGKSGGPPCEWTLVQCHRCRMPTVQLREDFGRGFSDDDNPATVYPAPPRISSSVPDLLRREWNEAQICLGAKAYAACAVMVRRTVEGTCKEQGVKERTLARSLETMAERGLIDGTLADWADALRIVGNKGAHFTGEVVSREDAVDALAFAEALLDHIYVLRKRFAQFQARLSSE